MNAIDVARPARYLYVVDAGVGVRVYDNELPASATLVATIPLPPAVRVVPWGIHLFIAAGADGLWIADICDPTDPALVRRVGGMNAVDVLPYAHYLPGKDFAVRAYVADPAMGVHVVELLPDYERAHVVAQLAAPGARGLDAYTRYVPATDTEPSREHDWLYVAAGENGLAVFDMTDPDAIVAAAMLNDIGVVIDVDVASELAPPGVDDYAYLASETAGMVVVDVTDPRAPTPLGAVPGAAGTSRVPLEVQQLDRFIDEQGRLRKGNSHPGIGTLSREDIVRILSAPIR